MFSRKSLIAVIAVFFTLGAAMPSWAGKGGSSSSPSIELNRPLLAAAAPSSWPALGSAVDFNTAYPKNAKNPRIDVQCFDASGALLYAEAGSTDHVFMLGGGSSDWLRAGGSANCTARLFDLIWNGNNPQQIVWLASTSFSAAG